MEQEQKAREGYDMVLAQNIAKLRNALVEKGILGPEHGANSDGHSIFSTCIVCDKIYPSLRSEYDDLLCYQIYSDTRVRVLYHLDCRRKIIRGCVFVYNCS